ncbi:hypothetical protein LUZ60_010637 [Juncus effusus]|nr:hypothetical protein LUZ60_010637 [Juncus effusus]
MGNHATMLPLIVVLLFGSIIGCQTLGDTLLSNQPLNDTTTLQSTKGTYVLGFFSPSNKTTRYLGIWYRDMSPLTVVWVANRQIPIAAGNGTLTLTTEGILNLKDGATLIWNTGTVITAGSKAQLLDSGNFVVTDDATGNTLWQSFDSPCDTLLPGMVLGYDSQAKISRFITAWKSKSDPALGDYLVRIEPKRLPDLLLYNNNTLEYRSGVWNGEHYDGIPEMRQTSQLVFNLSWTQTSVYYSFEPIDVSVLWRLVIQDDGMMHRWYSSSNAWTEYWHLPQGNCDLYAHCGLYGVCLNANSDCTCLPGFTPKATASWNLRNFSDGCVRSELFNCTKENDFMRLRNVKLPDTFNTTTLFGKTSSQCRSACLGDCSCVAFAYIDNKCAIWHDPLVDIVQFDSGDDLHLRVAASEKSRHISLVVIISAIVGGVLLLLVIIFLCIWCMCCLRRKRADETVGTQQSSTIIDIPPQPRQSNLFVDPETFDIKTLKGATNNFCDNKLGEGCFGPVYKATLEDGRVIAAKMLAKQACKGLRQFLNEVNLLANLSHRNLVQLLGYCTDDQERILCYEYMPNGSLDKFLDDPWRISKWDDSQFDWKTRSTIIEEISCGVLYLHDECGKKIVHRDLKPGNILLDEDMIPKISDFGFAKLCRKDQRSTYTEIFAGTRGYMAPEMLGGKISPKVDVFSFGIIIMEIITGKLATSFPTGIINHVTRYWMENKELELIDPRIKENADKEEIIRFIMIALLCVQQDQDKRPEMRTINLMLNSMTTLLPYVPRVLFVDWGISFDLPPLIRGSSVDLTDMPTPPSAQSSNS